MKRYNYCIYCGYKLHSDDIYCPNCGVKIGYVDDASISVSLTKYKDQVFDLREKYEKKEKEVLNLIEKRFAPPQITYYRFIGEIDNCRVLFFKEAESILDIINLVNELSPKIETEIKKKIDLLNKIMEQMDDLINELIINMGDYEDSNNEVQDVLDDMRNLIDSVKDYEY
ncbi:MAG: zinc ribbon domain-containing protein [Methanobrevibacter sp.]|nr:zinc ribbon domain-containing protein [Methanobrevibacter sp.]